MHTNTERAGRDQRAERASKRPSHAISQTLAVLALLVGLWVLPAAAQTGQVMPQPQFTFYNDNGDPCAGCLVYFYLAGTTTPTNTYTTAALSVANANPVVLDAAGRATIFGSPAISYKITVKTAAGVDIVTTDNVVGPFSSVVTISAANTRGLQISRASAEAGLSIASTGGSGNTYGIASNTSGALLIRDDADGTPNITISGNNVTTTATGVVATNGNQTVSGTLGVTGATTLTGPATLSSTISVSGAAIFAALSTFNSEVKVIAAQPRSWLQDTSAAANEKRWATALFGGDMYFQAWDDADVTSSEWMRVSRTGTTIDSVQFSGTAVLNTGRYGSATAQPGFLAYNSAIDSVATGGTVDFDTEVYDEAGNFAADTFTAPVTGRYHLCATVFYSDNSASSYGLRLVTTARTYQIDWSGASSSGVSAGCVYADMTAAHTAYIQVLTGDLDIDIEGGASPLVTFFSGRLVP